MRSDTPSGSGIRTSAGIDADVGIGSLRACQIPDAIPDLDVVHAGSNCLHHADSVRA